MNIELKHIRTIGRRTAEVVIIAAIVWAGMNDDHEQLRVLTFLEESCTFAIQALIITIVALAIVYCAQAIRACEWYDRHGAGTEIAKIRTRMNTTLEKPMDGISVAIQYASTTIMLAAILFGFFMIHG